MDNNPFDESLSPYSNGYPSQRRPQNSRPTPAMRANNAFTRHDTPQQFQSPYADPRLDPYYSDSSYAGAVPSPIASPDPENGRLGGPRPAPFVSNQLNQPAYPLSSSSEARHFPSSRVTSGYSPIDDSSAMNRDSPPYIVDPYRYTDDTSYRNHNMYHDPSPPSGASVGYPQDDPYQDRERLYGSQATPIPRPRPQRHSYFGYRNRSYDSDDGEDDYRDEENFAPFPVSGDQYDLNTYQYEDSNDYTPTDYDDDESEELSEGDSRSFSEVPNEPQPRRDPPPTVVQLFRGNFVLDFPVAPVLLQQFPERTEREFTHMRYSAVTCGPESFVANNFTLRQTCYMQPRATEIFICVTLYNEDDVDLARSLQGVFQNIRNLVRRKNSEIWKSDSWKKIVVCVVADGRKQINPRAQALLAALGLYQPGFGMSKVNTKPVLAHLYEYTTMLDVWVQGGAVKMEKSKSCPIQMIFCLKEENKQKINSHRWFFQAFGPILAPKICILIDAGTQPSKKAIYHLWKTFDVHGNVGGACGEIRASLGQGWHKLYNPLVAAQNFEYKMSNILDKPLESVFGYISVLPGAFSAYRYRAIQDGPLEKYYLGETKGESLLNVPAKDPSSLFQTYDGSDMRMEESPARIEGGIAKPVGKKRKFGIFDANMYLAEDRILCFELVMQKHGRWVSKYVKSAYAETDVPETLAELVLQRRRWLNGSFFAAIYSQAHFLSIWTSGHSIGRKFILQIEFFYQLLSLLLSWFSVGNFFLVFRILTHSLGDKSLGFSPGAILGAIILWVYMGSLVTMFVLSFGNRPKGTQAFYVLITSFFAILMIYLMFAAIYISVKSVEYALCENNGFTVRLVFENETFRDLVISTISTYALYFISSFMFFEPWHMFTSFVQYLLMSPSYINVFNVYAFCNIHDISWGTKSATKVETLGEAHTKIGGEKKEVFEVSGLSLPTEKSMMEERYIKQLELIKDPPVKEKKIPNPQDRTQDFYAMFRSVVVLAWVFTNVALCAVVLNTAGFDLIPEPKANNGAGTNTGANPAAGVNAKRSLLDLVPRALASSIETNWVEGLLERAVGLVARADCAAVGGSDTVQTKIYLSVILWMVAGLAAFRFIGATLYLTLRILGR